MRGGVNNEDGGHGGPLCNDLRGPKDQPLVETCVLEEADRDLTPFRCNESHDLCQHSTPEQDVKTQDLNMPGKP